MTMTNFIKIAHRGSSGSYPENTRIAFKKAIEAGVDMIEMDCQLSKDGHIVVIHDERLARTAGVRGLVKGKTIKQLKKLDVGAWFKKSFAGERILTLEEVMEIVTGKVALNLDIKTNPQGSLGIELKILFILSHYDYLEQSIISSFDYRFLHRIRELGPECKIGIICDKDTKDDPFQAAMELKAHAIQVHKSLVTPDFMAKSRELGLNTFVWTVNEVKEIEKLLSLGVQGVISDSPEKFLKVRSGGLKRD